MRVSLFRPMGVAVDSAGNVYTTSNFNGYNKESGVGAPTDFDPGPETAELTVTAASCKTPVAFLEFSWDFPLRRSLS